MDVYFVEKSEKSPVPRCGICKSRKSWCYLVISVWAFMLVVLYLVCKEALWNILVGGLAANHLRKAGTSGSAIATGDRSCGVASMSHSTRMDPRSGKQGRLSICRRVDTGRWFDLKHWRTYDLTRSLRTGSLDSFGRRHMGRQPGRIRTLTSLIFI